MVPRRFREGHLSRKLQPWGLNWSGSIMISHTTRGEVPAAPAQASLSPPSCKTETEDRKDGMTLGNIHVPVLTLAEKSVSFYFRITNIRGREGVPPRVCNSGLWKPPAGNDSVAISSQLFYFDGTTVHDVTYSVNPPDGSQIFRACSMYHDQGRFWAVNYDATQYAVDQGNRQDWYQLGFDHADCTSWVGIGGEQRRLGYQNPNQPWLRMLFPENHQPDRYTNDNRYGGLGGQLPLIIALIAFSISSAYLHHALNSCMRAGPWGFHQFPHGRSDGRGMVVTIYIVPGTSSKAILKGFEDSRVFPV